MRADADFAFVGQPFQPDEAGEAARAVAALRHFAAVGIEDTIVEIEIGIVRRLDDQQLIETDPQMAIRQPANQLRREKDVLRHGIHNHEIVAESVHFGELHFLLRRVRHYNYSADMLALPPLTSPCVSA